MFDLMKYLDLWGDNELRTVFGTWETALSRGDFLYLDYVLYGHQYLTNAIELGTMHGLTTIYLGVAMALRDGSVVSYDIKELKPAKIHNVAKNLPIKFPHADVLNDLLTIEIIRRLISNDHTLLFCDNGNKEREVELYARYLGQFSVLLAHDCWTEVKPENIQPHLTGFEPYHHEVAEAMSSHLRAWRKL